MQEGMKNSYYNNKLERVQIKFGYCSQFIYSFITEKGYYIQYKVTVKP